MCFFADFIRHECHLFVVTSGIHLTTSLMRLYSCLIDEIKKSGGEGGTQMPQLTVSLWLQCLLLFSLVWSIGGTMNGDSRKKFDVFFRTLVSGTDENHPRPKSFKLGKVIHGKDVLLSFNATFVHHCATPFLGTAISRESNHL